MSQESGRRRRHHHVRRALLSSSNRAAMNWEARIRSVTPPSPSGRGGTTLLRQRAPRSCTVFVMTPPNEHTVPVREGETIEGSRTMRNRPYPVLKCSKLGFGNSFDSTSTRQFAPVSSLSAVRESSVVNSFDCVPVLVPVRASPVPSVVRGSFVVRFFCDRAR